MGVRPEKEQLVEELAQHIAEFGGGVLADYRGLNVAELSALRRQVKEAGGVVRVAKNTLLRLAFAKAGIAGIEAHLEGPTAIAFHSPESPAVPKIAVETGKVTSKWVIKAAFLGQRLLDREAVERFAQLPNRPTLLANLLGSLQSPLAQLLLTLQTPLSELVGTLRALQQKRTGEASG